MTETEEKSRPPSMIEAQSLKPQVRIRVGLVFVFAGLLIFILGADPGLFGLDRSPVTGFVQIAVFLVGLAFISLGGFLALRALWEGSETSIVSDIGSRLVATGYVVAVASGMADIFGFGSETFPRVPDFGIWQQRGVLAGQVLIGIGFLLLFRWKKAAAHPEEE